MRTFLATCGALALMIPLGLVPSGTSVAEDRYRQGHRRPPRPLLDARRHRIQPPGAEVFFGVHQCRVCGCDISDCLTCVAFCLESCKRSDCDENRRRMRQRFPFPRREAPENSGPPPADAATDELAPEGAASSGPDTSDDETANRIQWRTSLRLVQQEAFETGRPLLLKFSASWCGPCHRMKSETFSDPELAAYINDHFIPVEIDADENQRLVRRLRVDSLPTTLVISPHGRIVQRRTGFQSATQLGNALAQYRSQPDERPLVLNPSSRRRP